MSMATRSDDRLGAMSLIDMQGARYVPTSSSVLLNAAPRGDGLTYPMLDMVGLERVWGTDLLVRTEFSSECIVFD